MLKWNQKSIEMAQHRLSRRSLVGIAVATTATSLLSACGDDEVGDDPVADGEQSDDEAGDESVDDDSGEVDESESADDTDEGDETTDGSAEGNTLVYAGRLDIHTLDPHFSAEATERYALYMIFNTIVRWDTEFELQPELAESWDVSEDGTQVEFHLVPDVEFHDGTPCYAEAVHWNLQRILDPDVGSPQQGQLQQIEDVEVVDETTLLITLAEPWRPFISTLGERPGFVVSPSAVDQYGEDFGRNPVGSGPFQFAEWEPDSHVAVERFENYWDPDEAHLDRIELRWVQDVQVQSTMLRTGEAHVIDRFDSVTAQELEESPEVVVHEIDGFRWFGMQVRVDQPPFDNLDVRRALFWGVDRQALKDILFEGTGRVLAQPLAGGWAQDPSITEAVEYDPELAREHLENSGLADEAFTLFSSNERRRQDMAQLLQTQYQEIGMNIEIETVDSSEAWTLAVEGETNWNIFTWTARADPDGLLRILYHTDGFQNHVGYSNPRVDELLDEAAGIYDQEEAAELYHEVERIVVEDGYYIILHAEVEYYALSENVEGFEWIPDSMLRLRHLRFKE